MQRRAWVIAAALLLAAAQRSVAADMPQVVEYGHLRGRFVYDGEPPMPKVALVAKGVAIADEHLVVNPKTRGIANIGVWLELQRDAPLPPIHPSYGMGVAKPDGPRVKQVTIAKNRIEPHFVLLRTDEMLVITNAEAKGVHVKVDRISTAPLVAILPPGAKQKAVYTEPERLPGVISSLFNPWMNARILVKNHPYCAVTDSDGNFEIRHLPAGEHEFQFWHEAVGYITTVSQGDVAQKWPRGKLKVKIPADDTLDLGLLLVPPKIFP